MADVIAELVARLGYEVDDKGLEEFDRGTEKAEKTAGRFVARITKATAAIAALGVGVVAFAAKFAVSIVQTLAEGAVEADTWAKKIGTSTQELQRLEFAAKRTGAEVDNMREATKTLRENLGELDRLGSGPALESLGSLGIKLEEIKDLPIEQQMQLISTALLELEDDSQRLSVAIELMGEDGAALLPLFQQGADGIAALGNEAEKTGAVLSKDQVRSAKAAQKAFADLEAMWDRGKTTLATALAPAITDVVERVTAWLTENEELISQRVTEFIEEAIPQLAGLASNIAEVVGAISDWIQELGGLDSSLTLAVAGIGALAIALGGIPGLVVAAGGALGFLIADLAGVTDEIQRLEASTARIRQKGQRIERSTNALNDISALLDDPSKLAQVSDEEYERLVDDVIVGSGHSPDVAAAADEVIARTDAQRARAKAAAAPDPTLISTENLALAARQRSAREREGRRRKFSKQAKGAGGSGGVDVSRAEALFGERLRSLGTFAGATDVAQAKALEAAAQSLEGGASESIAFGAAVGQLESLTGATLRGDIGTALEGAIGGGGLGGIGGGGAGPTAGARFVRIDASFNAPTSIEIHLPEGSIAGLSPDETMQVVESQIADVLDERNRRAFDHFRRNVEV